MPKSLNIYQKNQVMTVSKEKLLLMLCDGLVRFIRNAVSAFEKGNYEDINKNLLKAQAIVSELMVSLDRGAGEFAENIFSIYEFIHSGLMEANMKKDARQLQDLLKLAIAIQETWNEAAKAIKPDNNIQAQASIAN